MIKLGFIPKFLDRRMTIETNEETFLEKKKKAKMMLKIINPKNIFEFFTHTDRNN